MMSKPNSEQLVTLEPQDFIHAIKEDFGFDISNVEQSTNGYGSQVFKAKLDGKNVFIKINKKPDIFPVEKLGYEILKNLDIPVPEVIAYQDKPTHIGYSTIILSSADGMPISQANLTDLEQSVVYEEMGRILRKIHTVKIDGFGMLSVENGKLHGKFRSWKDSWEGLRNYYAEDAVFIREHSLLSDVEIDTASQALRELDLIDVPEASFLHRDMHRGHVFVTGDKITGIIDLGSVGSGDLRFDIATSFVFQTPMQQESFKRGYGEKAKDPVVRNFLLCIAARKIVFRMGKGNEKGVEEAKQAFRAAI